MGLEAGKICGTNLHFDITQAFAKQFNCAPDDLDMHLIYDVSHNIAKVEQHMVDGKQKTLLVHRKVSFLRLLLTHECNFIIR